MINFNDWDEEEVRRKTIIVLSFKNKVELYFKYIFKCKLTSEYATNNGLTFLMNVYGDRINNYNCRSLWVDDNFRIFRVKEMMSVDFIISHNNDLYQKKA